MQLGKVLRERFLAEADKAMVEVSAAVETRLTELLDERGTARDWETRRDIWTAYKTARPLWVESTMKQWRECLEPAKPKKPERSLESAGLELVGTEVVENKIVASRLVLAVNEKVVSELDDLRVRIRYLENTKELDGRDPLRPEVLVLLLVEQWAQSGMPADAWPLVNDTVLRCLIDPLRLAYVNANKTLIEKGVLPTIELKDRVTSPPRPIAGARPSRPPPAQNPAAGPQADYGSYQQGDAGFGGQSPQFMPSGAYYDSGPGAPPSFETAQPGGFFGGRLGWGSNAGSGSGSGGGSNYGGGSGPGGGSGSGGRFQGARGAAPMPGQQFAPHSSSAPFWRQSGGSGNSAAGQPYFASEETRVLTSSTPLTRARVRAQGVIGQIKRIFVGSVGPEYSGTVHHQPSLALVQALSPRAVAEGYAAGGTMYEDYSPAGVARVAGDLREKTAELKKKAETKGEKATVEIVALMFQSILSEERIPPGIRVWFARLQMPVLRVALEDADFFGTTDHPARLLIDRMGSCVMGFDATGVQGSAMEAEVRRVVQVIEQYPETGKKVYQIVYDEFQKFLAKFLTEKGSTQKVVSVAQQVEQRETLAIQYTIEMRNMLKDMPVRDEIRDYLFKVWADVLAVSALRIGAKHADTQTLKKSATDLVWAASAKPNRADRARVIQDLPNLLLRLRSGMTLLAMPPSEQEAHVKKISDTLADAFLSKTQVIPQAKIDAMAQRLSNLEDFVSEDGVGDLPLDAESLEMMLGIDASAIEVVANGGSKPTAAMLAWAGELQLGSWYTLDHNSQITKVQFAWRSERKHLNLFASSAGKSYLIQAGRLAAYLQAGLLLPQEDEALTVRATRDALAKIEANPERLLA